MSDFDDYLKAFTDGTLSLVNSKNQISAALNNTNANTPQDTRQDKPVSTAPIPMWLLLLGGFVVYKLATK